jgi:hypothetical protein
MLTRGSGYFSLNSTVQIRDYRIFAVCCICRQKLDLDVQEEELETRF